jgi:hypothetical protein
VNVTALTYAFVEAANTEHLWRGIDDRQNSIFNIGQLDYLRTRHSQSLTKHGAHFWTEIYNSRGALGFMMLCEVISAVTEFMVRVLHSRVHWDS